MVLIKLIKNLFIFSLDVWDNIATYSPDSRMGVVGMSNIGGICTANQYSIVEYLGLNSIQNNAHELGHK